MANSSGTSGSGPASRYFDFSLDPEQYPWTGSSPGEREEVRLTAPRLSTNQSFSNLAQSSYQAGTASGPFPLPSTPSGPRGYEQPMVRFIQDSGPFTPILRYQNDSNFVNLPSAPVTSRSNAPRSDSGYATQPPHTPSSTVIGLGEGSKDLSDARRPWPQGYYTSGQAAPMLVNTHGEAASKTSIFQGYKKIYRCARADCDKQCRSHSELTKHNMKHEKPFKCTELGCARDTGFTSNNDLDRHKKSVHKIEIPGSSSYRCASLKCPKSNHIWPRLDNFKAHIKRLHPDENPETLALRSIIMVPRSRRGDEALLLGMDASKYSMPSSGDARLLTEASGWSSIRGVKRKNDEPHEGSREKRVQIAEGAEKPTDSSSSQDVSLLDEAYDMDLPEAPASCNPNELLTNQTWTTSLSPTLTRQNLPPTVTETDLTTSNVETQQEDPNVPGRLQRSAVADASHTNAETSVAPSTTLTESAEPNERLSDDTEDSMGTTEAMEAPATLAQAMANLISENRLTNPEHLVQQVAQFIQRSGLARNVVDNGSNAATPRPSNMVAELDSTRSLPRNRDSSGTFKCRDCGKFSNRACDMKKHEKRHSRPYGCTFTGCMKTLGSKNDWKRHENIQHFPSEFWRCQEPGSVFDHCAHVEYQEDAFKKHLEESHELSDSALTDVLEQYHAPRNHQRRFWCGFCRKLCKLDKFGVPAWDERFNHIDTHFKQGESIGNWLDPYERVLKSQMLERQLFAAPVAPDVAAARRARGRGEQPSPEGRVATPRVGKKKKKPDDMAPRSQSWYCCGCNAGPSLKQLNTRCLGCEHIMCDRCTTMAGAPGET